MDKVSRKYNIRNNIVECWRVFYNPLAKCDTAILMDPKFAARATHISVSCSWVAMCRQVGQASQI